MANPHPNLTDIEIADTFKDWNYLAHKVTYAQLLERLTKTHGIEQSEAIDILQVALISASRDEANLL